MLDVLITILNTSFTIFDVSIAIFELYIEIFDVSIITILDVFSKIKLSGSSLFSVILLISFKIF